MPDSTTINYLDLMRSGKIPIKITEFQHYVTPEDTSRYNPIAIIPDYIKMNQNGYKRNPDETSEGIQKGASNNRDRINAILDHIGFTGALGGVALGRYVYRHSDMYNFNRTK